ncbi:MAG: cation diffusion facilitator family transporter [Caulobacteraceae bacterium]
MSEKNFGKIKRVLWIILFANFGVALLKIMIGNIIKSTSLMADGFHSFADGSSNIIGLIGIGLAAKPVDNDHPYGHRKFETLASLFIAGMLIFISGKIITEAVSRFLHPVIPQITMESLITLLVTLGVNIFVSTYEYRAGKKLGSYILMSDSLHTRSDIYVSIGVLLTLICVRRGVPILIDPIASLAVSGFIIHAAYEIFMSTSGILVDKIAVDTEKIKDVTMRFDQVKDVHKIRSRGSESDMYVDMHVMVEPNISVEESHLLTHEIEKRIQEEINSNAQVIVHLEPYYDSCVR